jgi:hypothetical protein
MNIDAGHLDDRTFDDLVQEALSLLPAWAPDWTNHNPSDPGITMVELLAYFTEILIYRLGRVTPRTRLQFVRLLKGAEWEGWNNLVGANAEELRAAINDAVRELAHCNCAVSAEDYEVLAREAAAAWFGPQAPAVRAMCVPGADLETGREASGADELRPHVSVVLLPGKALDGDTAAELFRHVRHELQDRSLLTTRVHVVGPTDLYMALRCRVAPQRGAPMERIRAAVVAEVERRYGWHGHRDPEADGQRLGNAVHLARIVEAIDRLPDVDYLEDLTVVQLTTREDELSASVSALGIQIGLRSTVGVDTWLGGPPLLGPGRLMRNDAGRLLAIGLRPWELPRLIILPEEIEEIGGGDDDVGRS